MYFPDRGCVHTLLTLYVYATVCHKIALSCPCPKFFECVAAGQSLVLGLRMAKCNMNGCILYLHLVIFAFLNHSCNKRLTYALNVF